jgi:hypothetical protein
VLTIAFNFELENITIRCLYHERLSTEQLHYYLLYSFYIQMA